MEATQPAEIAPIEQSQAAQHDHSAPELPAQRAAVVTSGVPQASGVPEQQALQVPAKGKASAKVAPKDEELEARCRSWYASITEHCGGPMTKGGQVINEHKSVKALCQKYSDAQIKAIFVYLTTRDWKWSKIDNKYNVRAFVLHEEAARVGQILKEEREAAASSKGQVSPTKAAILDSGLPDYTYVPADSIVYRPLRRVRA